MKKLFSLLTLALLSIGSAWASTQTLINYPVSKDGIAIVEGGTASFTTVKIHADKDSKDCIKFNNSGTNNGVALTYEGGFKAGDIIKIAGAVSLTEADAASKRACVEIYAESNGKQEKQFTTQDFVNGKLSANDPVVETFTLETDCEKLVLARNGGTGANVTLLTVTRGGDESDEPGDEETNNWFGLTQSIDESAHKLGAATFTGIDHVTNSGNLMGGKVDNYTLTGSTRTPSIDGTTYSTESHWRKTVNTSTYDDEQWMGYNLTIDKGYKLNITGVHAMLAVADNTYKWKVVILDASGNELYKSEDNTTTKETTPDFKDVQVDLAGITSGVSVRIYMYQGGTQKYFAVPYLTITGTIEEDTRATNTITANVAEGQETWGSIDNDGDNDVVEGGSIALTATANEGYVFSKWTKESDSSWSSTDNPLVVSNVTAAETYTASFEKLFKVTFDLGEYNGTITGKTLNQFDESRNINEKYADINGNYTIPSYADKYLYNEGNIFKEWTDSEGNTYATGAPIVLTKDITLTPTWTETTTLAEALSNASAETTVTWAFAKADILFNDWQSSNYGYYTVNATINGETIAVPMKIANGKVSNQGRTDKLAQINKETKFTIPAVSGMVISIPNAYTNFSTTTIAGSTEYTGTGTKSISYTYTGTDETIDIVIGETNQYLETIVVTYPAQTVAMIITEAGCATFSNESEVAIPEGVTAYYASANSENTVTLTEIMGGYIPAKTGVVVAGKVGTYYAAKSTTNASALTGNLLKAQLEDGTPDETTYYTLAAGPVFKKSSGGVLAAGKAYLVLTAVTAGARELSVVFGEATGISEVQEAADENAAVYNLNGVRVNNPSKGLYIVNGKKVIK